MKILVTGANGFVGRALIPSLLKQGHQVVAATRKKGVDVGDHLQRVTIGDIGPQTDWREALQGCGAIVHLAGRAHVMGEGGFSPLYHRVNVEGSRQLFSQASDAGVEMFVYASSIKATGESSGAEAPLDELSPPSPEDDYGKSKLQAEETLTDLAAKSGVTLTILRFPLVYGPGVAANMAKLLDTVRRGGMVPNVIPENIRSFLYIGNLVSAIETAMSQKRGGLYHLSDGVDFSTGALAKEMAKALGTSPRLIPAPVPLLRMAGWLGDFLTAIGFGFPLDSLMVRRLTGSLQVDSRKFRHTFNWTPPFTPAEGLREMVR